MSCEPPGQLLPAERALLREAVFHHHPDLVLEVGTWYGGGSTWQLVQALTAASKGHLHTCEVDLEHYLIAAAFYQTNPFVTCHHKPGLQLINELIAVGTIPDLIFFDGQEEPEAALSDLQLLEPQLKPGAAFLMHDWDLNVLSTKSALIRPYLEQSPRWQIRRQLTAPESVGLVWAVFNGYEQP